VSLLRWLLCALDGHPLTVRREVPTLAEVDAALLEGLPAAREMARRNLEERSPLADLFLELDTDGKGAR
jgi:hypothetical protein